MKYHAFGGLEWWGALLPILLDNTMFDCRFTGDEITHCLIVIDADNILQLIIRSICQLRLRFWDKMSQFQDKTFVDKGNKFWDKNVII